MRITQICTPYKYQMKVKLLMILNSILQDFAIRHIVGCTDI